MNSSHTPAAAERAHREAAGRPSWHKSPTTLTRSRVRRPDRERTSRRRRPSSRRCAPSIVPQPAVRALAEEVEVHLAERRQEAVRIAALPRRAVRGDGSAADSGTAASRRGGRRRRSRRPPARMRASPTPCTHDGAVRRVGLAARATTTPGTPFDRGRVRAEHLMRVARAAPRAARARSPRVHRRDRRARRGARRGRARRRRRARSSVGSWRVLARFGVQRLVAAASALVAIAAVRRRSAAASASAASTVTRPRRTTGSSSLRRVHHHRPRSSRSPQRGQREVAPACSPPFSSSSSVSPRHRVAAVVHLVRRRRRRSACRSTCASGSRQSSSVISLPSGRSHVTSFCSEPVDRRAAEEVPAAQHRDAPAGARAACA